MRTLIFALTFALAAGAQTPTYGSLARSGAIIDHTSAAKTAPVQSGTPLPAACTVGQLFYKTDATAGSNIYGCTAANTWTAQGGSYALPAASGSVLGGIKIGAGLTIDGNGVASASGGAVINGGAGNGVWFPWGATSYSPGGVTIGGAGANAGLRYALIVPAAMEFRAIHAYITTASGVSCTGGACGLQFAIYNQAMTSIVASTITATSGGTPSINATGAARFAFGGGTAVSGGVLTLPAGSYWLVASTDSTVLQIASYGSSITMTVANATTTTSLAPSGTQVAFAGSLSTGNGGSLALTANNSGKTWSSSAASTYLPVVALVN